MTQQILYNLQMPKSGGQVERGVALKCTAWRKLEQLAHHNHTEQLVDG